MAEAATATIPLNADSMGIKAVVETFQGIMQFRLIPIGGDETWITVGNLLSGITIIILIMILGKLLRTLLLSRLLAKTRLDSGLQYTLLQIIHYLILVFAIYTGLGAVGIPLTALTGLFALIGVGIGFGLQNITSNFISGVILLFERPVKVGDRITVDDVVGDVVQIKLRTTIVNTVDNISIIIPNSKLLENNLINWTYGDAKVRIHVPVGVAYGSDVDLVTKLLLLAADEDKEILQTPKPAALFIGFGDSSLDFDLIVWIPDSRRQPLVTDRLNRAIDKLFREHDVEIPFPQRDLHIRSDATKK